MCFSLLFLEHYKLIHTLVTYDTAVDGGAAGGVEVIPDWTRVAYDTTLGAVVALGTDIPRHPISRAVSGRPQRTVVTWGWT